MWSYNDSGAIHFTGSFPWNVSIKLCRSWQPTVRDKTSTNSVSVTNEANHSYSGLFRIGIFFVDVSRQTKVWNLYCFTISHEYISRRKVSVHNLLEKNSEDLVVSENWADRLKKEDEPRNAT